MTNLFYKFKQIIEERRLPWVLEVRIRNYTNFLFYIINKSYNAFKIKNKFKPRVCFICGFHGISGGVIAIANIANLLSEDFCVYFISHPKSFYNLYLNFRSVIIKDHINFDEVDFFICDASVSHDILSEIKRWKKLAIVTCHGFPRSAHGLSFSYLRKTLELADCVHFVSEYQRQMFKFPLQQSVVIPNFTYKICKTINTDNIGLVGRHSDPKKNSRIAVELALKSRAPYICVWGDNSFCYNNPRVKIHGWTKNRKKIYNSFDVLLSLSKEETFGMVVIEAMSCGIPCVLSDIPAFRGFQDNPGVKLVSFDKLHDVPYMLNEFLLKKDELKNDIIKYWEKYYSQKSVNVKWKNCLGFGNVT